MARMRLFVPILSIILFGVVLWVSFFLFVGLLLLVVVVRLAMLMRSVKPRQPSDAQGMVQEEAQGTTIEGEFTRIDSQISQSR